MYNYHDWYNKNIDMQKPNRIFDCFSILEQFIYISLLSSPMNALI